MREFKLLKGGLGFIGFTVQGVGDRECVGASIGESLGVIKGDAWSLDYSSYERTCGSPNAFNEDLRGM